MNTRRWVARVVSVMQRWWLVRARGLRCADQEPTFSLM